LETFFGMRHDGLFLDGCAPFAVGDEMRDESAQIESPIESLAVKTRPIIDPFDEQFWAF